MQEIVLKVYSINCALKQFNAKKTISLIEKNASVFIWKTKKKQYLNLTV